MRKLHRRLQNRQPDIQTRLQQKGKAEAEQPSRKPQKRIKMAKMETTA